MIKTILLVGTCGLLGGCMATVSPRGDVAVSYVPPVYEEIYVAPRPQYISVVSTPRPVYMAPVRPVAVARPRPFVRPKPPRLAGQPGSQVGPSHPGNGHHPGSSHGVSHPGHGTMGGNSGGHSPRQPSGPRPGTGQVKMQR